ncbi:Dynamin, partial [Pseudolycoriella hygida]
MDRGTDARYIFDNRVKPLSGGYIGVVNRSQEDIVKGKDIKATLEFERDFFNKHDNAQLINRLKEEVRMHLTNLEKELNNFENVYPREKKDTIRLIFNIIYDLQQNFEIEMGSLSSNYIHNARLSHGAKIRHIFQEVLVCFSLIGSIQS